MTQQDSIVIDRNTKAIVALIITIVTCTTTFVWQGAKYANRIDNNSAAVQQNRQDIAELKSSDRAQDNRLSTLEFAAKYNR